MGSFKHVSMNLTIDMLSDFHISSGTGIVGLADRAVLRAANKELMIPGSTIKGRTRHHCEQLARSFRIKLCRGKAEHSEMCKSNQSPCLICRLFGSEWMPGSLRFSDAHLSPSLRNIVRQQGDEREFDYQVVSRTRTRINRVLRRVEEGALFTFEEGVEGLSFESSIIGSVLCSDTEVAGLPLEVVALVASLGLVERLGGKKTVGLGECAVTLSSLKVEKAATTAVLQEVIKNHLEELALYDDYRD